MQERQIRVIPGRNSPVFSQCGLKRACAYVRVSTGHDAQMHSLQNQTEYYERKIKDNPRYVVSTEQAKTPAFTTLLSGFLV